DSLYFRRRCLRRVGYLLPYPLLDRFGADRPDLDPRDHLRRPRRRQREQGTVVPLPGEYPAAEIIRPNRPGAPPRPQKEEHVLPELSRGPVRAGRSTGQPSQIGRASCRERAAVEAGGRFVEENREE